MTKPYTVWRHVTKPYTVWKHVTKPYTVWRHVTKPYMVWRHVAKLYTAWRHITDPHVFEHIIKMHILPAAVCTNPLLTNTWGYVVFISVWKAAHCSQLTRQSAPLKTLSVCILPVNEMKCWTLFLFPEDRWTQDTAAGRYSFVHTDDTRTKMSVIWSTMAID